MTEIIKLKERTDKLISCGNTKCWDYDPSFKCHCFKRTFATVQKCPDFIPNKETYEKTEEKI